MPFLLSTVGFNAVASLSLQKRGAHEQSKGC